MTLRTKLSLIIGGGVLLILLLIIVALFAGRDVPEETLIPLEPSPAAPALLPPTLEPIPTTPIVLRTTEAAFDLEAFVKSFTERFGSFSNASNYENIEELRGFMTPQMILWAEQFVAEAREKATGGEYYGMTTRALSLRSVVLDEAKGRGTVVIATQRREVRGTGTPTVVYQDATLELRKIGEEWKVEGVEWK